MKRIAFLLFFTGGIYRTSAVAQINVAADQNPDYAASRSKYMALADSLTAYHGTTVQQTYKAIDWLTDKKAAKEARRQNRQQLRLERIRLRNVYGYSQFGYPYSNYRLPYYGSYDPYRFIWR